jgi:hypothetical protein
MDSPLHITCLRRGIVAGPADASFVPSYIQCLERAGHRLSFIGDDPSRIPERGLFWIQGSIAWYPRVRRRLIAMPPQKRPPVLIWFCEPLPPPNDSGLPWPRLNLREIAKVLLRDPRATDVYTNYLVLRRLARFGLPNFLVVSATGRQRFLAERGIVSHFVPFGYDPDMGRDLALPRDIDVLFIGALNVPRRNRLLQFLRRQGVNLTAVGDWSDPAFWGENRTLLLNRSRILLNFARTPAEYSGMRLLLGMANKALVISEPMYDPAPYVPGRHFISAPVEQMPDLIRHYLDHEDERRLMVEEAHRFVTTEHTLDRAIARIFEIVSSSALDRKEERLA